MAGLFWVVISGSSPVLSRAHTCDCNPPIDSSVTIQDCAFQDCQSREPYGGALSVDDGSVILGIVSCIFQDCNAFGFGGAIYAGVLSFAMNWTTGAGCLANTGGFCFVGVIPTQNGSLQITDTSAVSCAADFYSVYCGGMFEWDNTTICLLSALNITASDGQRGTALVLFELSQCWVRYSTFSDNWDGSCLYLVDDIFTHDIACIALCNNTAANEFGSELIFVQSHLRLVYCIFQGNRYNFFLTTYYDTAVDVTLVQCIFDVKDVNGIRSVAFVIKDCSFKITTKPAVAVGECPWAPRSSRTLVIVIASVVSALVIVLVILVIVMYRRKAAAHEEIQSQLLSKPDNPYS
jgi:hypothetical protein